MIPTIIKTDSQLQPSPAKSVLPVTPVTASTPTQDALSKFVPGQKYQALVEAKLPNGNSRVLIADQLLQMQLPQNIKPGKQITLTFVSHEPKLKFLLQNNSLNANKPDFTISSTGRFLGILTQNTIKTGSPPMLTTTPVLPSPLINSMEIPVLLRQAISQSGLFYEAHQAQWIAGKKNVMQLKQEPQSKLTAHLPTMIGIGADDTASSMPVHAKSLSLVQQQMAILDTGVVIWNGEIWPDQTMEWQISEQASEEEKDETECTQYKTKLCLSLPNLGEITANITINTHGMRVKLDATEPNTAQILENNSSPLAQNMAAVGLKVDVVEVQHDEKG